VPGRDVPAPVANARLANARPPARPAHERAAGQGKDSGQGNGNAATAGAPGNRGPRRRRRRGGGGGGGGGGNNNGTPPSA
ncbi:hypothetical protein, partial [Klebsiella pneumoniae]